MSSLLQKHATWTARREQRSLERWHRIRAQGLPRFVLETTAAFGLTMAGISDVLDNIQHTSHPITLTTLFFYLCGGFAAGLVSWANMEKKYNKALNKTPPAPPDPQLRITP